MKAITLNKYGSPEKVLSISELPIPEPKDDEILIKIKTTAVNDYDWCMVTGRPLAYRPVFGFFKPRNSIPGMEFSGEIVACGKGIKEFKIGDQVFGDTSDDRFGTFAEYICLKENSLIHKSEKLSHEESVCIPHAGGLAFQALFTLGKLEKGMKVLFNGAGGGVGAIDIQIANLYECHVTGIDSNDKMDLLLELGCDEVFDYKKVNFTRQPEKYDLIIDCKTTRSAFNYSRVLEKGGRYITVGGYTGKLISTILLGNFIPGKSFKLLPLKANHLIKEHLHLFEERKIKCKIDGPYEFEKIPGLIQYFGEARHKGKIVISNND